MVTVSHCEFVGVRFDATSVEAIRLVAEGLIENARGLHALATLFHSQNIHVDTLLTVQEPPKPAQAAEERADHVNPRPSCLD